MKKMIQGGVLLLLAAMFMVRRWDGTLPHYVHVRFEPLVLAASLGFAALAWAMLRSAGRSPHGGHKPSGWALTLVAVAALLGILVPPRSLDSMAAQRRGVRAPPVQPTEGSVPATAGAAVQALPHAVPIRSEPVMDVREGFLFLQDNLFDGVRVRGVPVEVTGFVMHDLGDDPHHFTVARFVLVCCVADASAMGLPVRWDGGGLPAQDAWVHIRGVFDQDVIHRTLTPVIHAEAVEPVAAPDDPYLYPARRPTSF